MNFRVLHMAYLFNRLIEEGKTEDGGILYC